MLLFAICVDPLLGLICLILDIEKVNSLLHLPTISVSSSPISKNAFPNLLHYLRHLAHFLVSNLTSQNVMLFLLPTPASKLHNFDSLFLPLHRNGAPSKSLALRSISVFFLDPMLTTLSGMVLFARLPTLSEDGNSSIPVSVLTFLLVMFAFFTFSHTLVSLFTLTTRLSDL